MEIVLTQTESLRTGVPNFPAKPGAQLYDNESQIKFFKMD